MKPMKVNVTTFTNPFSFFCVINESSNEYLLKNHDEGHFVGIKSISDVNHGQYVAVMWKNKWTRGVITMESQFLIWLVDYGIFIHPDDKSVYIDLPLQYKKIPTKVFEAAVHGVVPIDKYINDELEIENKISTSWNMGSIEKCQELIKKSLNVYFMPLAVMSTKCNDIVLGDLYLEIPGKKIVSLIDELELWPMFLKKNKTAYFKNLSKYYVTRRKHRASTMKPEFCNELPIVTLDMTLDAYNTLIDKLPDVFLQLQSVEPDANSDTETEVQDKKTKDAFRLTPAEIEKYSNLFITVHGHKYNVLNVLVNKARDLRMCERYKDLRSIGRGFSFRGHVE